MRTENWLRDLHAGADRLLQSSLAQHELNFATVVEAFDLIACDGPRCEAAVLLAKYLRVLPLEYLIGAAGQGAIALNGLADGVRAHLRAAPDDHLRRARTVGEAAAIFERPAETFRTRGEQWIDRPVSRLGSAALALQALEWAVREPRGQMVAE